MRTGQQFTWRGMRLTLLPLRYSGVSDQAEFVIDLLRERRGSMTRRVSEFRSIIVGDFRIRVLKIRRNGRVIVEISDLRPYR